jgi:hypothetical protein
MEVNEALDFSQFDEAKMYTDPLAPAARGSGFRFGPLRGTGPLR